MRLKNQERAKNENDGACGDQKQNDNKKKRHENGHALRRKNS
jgi:hypothetical protein